MWETMYFSVPFRCSANSCPRKHLVLVHKSHAESKKEAALKALDLGRVCHLHPDKKMRCVRKRIKELRSPRLEGGT